jgi:hypothetical protein
MHMAATAAVLLSALPAAAGDGGQATTFFDVPAGGVLASLVTAVVSVLGTWAAMRGSAQRQRQRQTTKIEDQPIKVETVPGHPDDGICYEKHRSLTEKLELNEAAHSEIFLRLRTLEKASSATEAQLGLIASDVRDIKNMLMKGGAKK